MNFPTIWRETIRNGCGADLRRIPAEGARLCCGKIQELHDAEDIVTTWMYIITSNTVTDYYRIRSSMAAFEDYMLEEAPAMDLTVDAPDNRADALMSLKENECGLIVLHNYTRNTLKTVTEMMEISNINAKVIHKKALTSLQAFYAAG